MRRADLALRGESGKGRPSLVITETHVLLRPRACLARPSRLLPQPTHGVYLGSRQCTELCAGLKLACSPPDGLFILDYEQGWASPFASLRPTLAGHMATRRQA